MTGERSKKDADYVSAIIERASDLSMYPAALILAQRQRGEKEIASHLKK